MCVANIAGCLATVCTASLHAPRALRPQKATHTPVTGAPPCHTVYKPKKGTVRCGTLARTEPPLSTATLEFGDPPAPLAVPYQNAIAEIGMLGCMALDGDGLSPCPGDLNNDGVVDGMDLGILITVWGGCP